MKKLLIAAVLTATALTSFAQTETWVENFNDNSNDWWVGKKEKYTAEIKNGAYNFKRFVEGSTCFRVYKNVNALHDYSIEMKATQISGIDNNGFGVQWGHYTWDDYYKFIISSNGYIKCYGKENDEDDHVQKWMKLDDASIIKPMGQANTIKVEQKGNKMNFYVNGTKVLTRDRIKVIGSWVGPVITDSMHVNFDYIKITCKKEEMNEIPNSINGYKLENLGANVNSKGSERSPKISADGKTIYFSRESENNLFKAEKSEIWKTMLQEDGTWSRAVNLGKPLNNSGNNFCINISPDYNTMYVGNEYKTDGSAGGRGLSKSVFKDGSWTIPKLQTIQNLVNEDQYVNYCITPDGKHLISAIENKNSLGDLDLFVSTLQDDGTWSEPKNMGMKVNTYSSDFGPFMAPDNKTLYYSSEGLPGYGSADIFVTKRLDNTWTNWSEPQNLGKEINSSNWDAYYIVSGKGDYAYMVRSGAKDGFGDDDIYRIKLHDAMKPDPIAIVNGKVYDKKTNQPIEAAIVYEDLNTGEELGIATSTMQNGFKLALPKGSKYGFLAKAKGYIAVSENLDLRNIKEYEERDVNLYLVPIEKGQTVRINNLFFDVGKYSLRSESYNDLNRLVKILKNNASMQIEIQGHTDNQGSDESNNTLSKNRAKAVYDYLVKKGINASRLSFKGYGEAKPIASNETSQGKQLNRRVEFLIK